MQAAPYDPLHLIALLIPHTQALTFGAAMTFFIAGLFTRVAYALFVAGVLVWWRRRRAQVR